MKPAALAAIKLQRHARARCLRLRIDPITGAAILTVPKRTSLAEAARFVTANQDWIAHHQAKVPEAQPFTTGQRVSLFGQEITLLHDATHRGRPLLVGSVLRVGGQPAFFPRRVQDYVKEEALRQFKPLVQDLAARLGVKVTHLTLRDTATRWGSCAATGAMNLNWRLAFAPSAVAHYVMAHEVAHLKEMNHSPAFWAHVQALMPDYRTQKQWLKQHGGTLLRLGRVA